MKEIIGYVRSIPGGEGIANVPVSIRLKKDGTLVPAGGMAQASANPILTDANGRFSWSCELSPGILKVEAAIDSTAEMKVRVGDEIMQADDMFISDISTLGQMFTNGVIEGIDNKFAVTPVVGSLQVAVAAGAININGHVFRTHTVRNLTIDANPTFTTRIDTVYVTHYHSGPDKGKQVIGVAKGIANNTPAAVPVVANTWNIEIARVNVPLGATSVTATSIAPIAAPSKIKINDDSILLRHLAPEVEAKLTDSIIQITSPTNGQHLAYNGSKFVNENNTLANLDDAVIASPVAGQVLTYNSGKWRNVAPSIASASDTVITAPATNDFLVYSSGKWRNAELNINIPAAKYAQSVFSAYGNLPNNNVLLASCTVTVPAGTWLLKAEATGAFYGINVGGGTNNLWFQGDALSGQSLAHTQVVLYSDQGVDQGYHHTSGRIVTVASTTTFTLDLWVSGGNIYMRGGKLTLMAV